MRILVLITAYITGTLAHGRAHHHTPWRTLVKPFLWVIGGLAAVPLAILIVYLTVAMTGWYLYFFAALLGGTS